MRRGLLSLALLSALLLTGCTGGFTVAPADVQVAADVGPAPDGSGVWQFSASISGVARPKPTPTLPASAPTATTAPTATVAPSATPTGTPTPVPPTATATPSTTLVYKGSSGEFGGDTAKNRQYLDSLQTVGVKVVRATLGWLNYEQTNGVYDQAALATLDTYVADAEARGMTWLLGVARPPCWASADPGKNCSTGSFNQWYRPSSAVEYGQFVAFLAQRYQGRAGVLAFEIWNEPNNPAFWGGVSQWDTQQAANDYVPLVKEARRQAPAGTKIVAGSVANAGWQYVDYLYQAGIKGQMDYLAVHPYVWMDPKPGGEPESCVYKPMTIAGCPDASGVPTAGLPRIRKVQTDRGDSVPIWVTEFGWTSGWVTEAVQADYLTRAVTLFKSMPYVELALWYNGIDLRFTSPSYDLGNRECCFGLFRADRIEKPAAIAFRNVTTR